MTALSRQTLLRRTGAILAVLMVATPLAACSDEGKLVLHSSTGDYPFNIEVVDTPESRAKGLMFVQDLADDAGMLFDFKQEQNVSFWMQNTFIPLDMLFIRADGTVARIAERTEPLSTRTIPSGEPILSVLEINGGVSKQLGIKPGDKVEHALFKR